MLGFSQKRSKSDPVLDVRHDLTEVGGPIVVASFPRSGTHLAIDLLRRHVQECRTWKHFGAGSHHLYLPLEGLLTKRHVHPEDAVLRRIRRPKRPIIKTHSLPSFEPWLEQFGPWIDWIRSQGRFVYVYRDGRSTLCSLYTGRRGMFPESRNMSISEFLRLERDGMSLPQRWAYHVDQWLGVEGVVAVRFRQMIEQPRQVIQRLAEAFDLTPRCVEPLLPKLIRSRWHGRWVRLTSRRPQSTALVSGRYRQVQSSNWADVFSHEDRLFFHREAGQMLIRLGMEVTDEWVKTGRSTVAT